MRTRGSDHRLAPARRPSLTLPPPSAPSRAGLEAPVGGPPSARRRRAPADLGQDGLQPRHGSEGASARCTGRASLSPFVVLPPSAPAPVGPQGLRRSGNFPAQAPRPALLDSPKWVGTPDKLTCTRTRPCWRGSPAREADQPQVAGSGTPLRAPRQGVSTVARMVSPGQRKQRRKRRGTFVPPVF